MLRRALARFRRNEPAPLPAPWRPDDNPYAVRPMGDVAAETERAARFWASRGADGYYRSFQPQTLLVSYICANVGAQSVLEFGCNVGRNLHWLKRTLGVSIYGTDVNEAAVTEGQRYFGFALGEVQAGGASVFPSFPRKSLDVAFTVSVLDHIPDPFPILRELLRIARKRVVLVELTLRDFGVVDDPRCVPFSYSHDYDAMLGSVGASVVRKTPTPLGEGILEWYTTLEVDAGNP